LEEFNWIPPNKLLQNRLFLRKEEFKEEFSPPWIRPFHFIGKTKGVIPLALKRSFFLPDFGQSFLFKGEEKVRRIIIF
jgi:hypothetical protein